MINKTTKDVTDLSALRDTIDSLDKDMHQLLIQRSIIIEQLTKAKKTSQSGSAFRPDREAQVLYQRAEQHQGLLPFAAIENIWRIIISTFTHEQAPFSVHGDSSRDHALMQDAARFNFGFVVPYQAHDSTEAVIEIVSASKGDLGLLWGEQTLTPWWTALCAPSAPKIIAQLPFALYDTHPVPTPMFIIAKPVSLPIDAQCASSQHIYAFEFQDKNAQDQIIDDLSLEVLLNQPDNTISNSCSCLVRSEHALSERNLVAEHACLLNVHKVGYPPKPVIL